MINVRTDTDAICPYLRTIFSVNRTYDQCIHALNSNYTKTIDRESNEREGSYIGFVVEIARHLFTLRSIVPISEYTPRYNRNKICRDQQRTDHEIGATRTKIYRCLAEFATESTSRFFHGTNERGKALHLTRLIAEPAGRGVSMMPWLLSSSSWRSICEK